MNPGPSRYVPRARRRPISHPRILTPNPSSLAISIRCTSEVPSPILEHLGVAVEAADRGLVHEAVAAEHLGGGPGVGPSRR